MTYAISGLAAADFAPLFDLSDEALAARGVHRRIVDAKPSFPCRITLEDAEVGERVLLLNYESLPGPSPFRTTYAIFVREAARKAATYLDTLPPVFLARELALRAFDADGFLLGAEIARDEAIDGAIRKLFADARVATIHAHNPGYGCFIARIDRA